MDDMIGRDNSRAPRNNGHLLRWIKVDPELILDARAHAYAGS